MLKKKFDVSPRHVNRFSQYSFDCKTVFIFQLFSLLYYTLTGQAVKISTLTHANEAIANTWNFLKSYLVSSKSVWKVFWSNGVLGRWRFFLWENKPFGSYYVSYGLTLSLVKKFEKGFLINLDNCCSCASHRKIILREILPRQYDHLISLWIRNEKGLSCSILVKHLLIICFWLI